MELVERSDKGIVAQVKAMSWADHYPAIVTKFKKVTGSVPENGMQVMLLCSVNFHPLYGLSLIVTDIEPSFTLGELARLKNEAIARLKTEQLFDRNKKLFLPLLPSRLAIISVDTSRGYQDFIQTILSHSKKYKLSWSLFEAILQGDNALATITKALDAIHTAKDQFDAVAIIRGGAGETGLACYDDYLLAKAIALFPLPVLTGIGHATNETVVEMVAFKSFITPTAAAQFLLNQFEEQDQKLEELRNGLTLSTTSVMERKRADLLQSAERFNVSVRAGLNNLRLVLQNSSGKLRLICSHSFEVRKNNVGELARELKFKASGIYFSIKQQQFAHFIDKLKMYGDQLIINNKQLLGIHTTSILTVKKQFSERKLALTHLEEKVSLLSPAETLKRGYSITRSAGHAVTDAAQLSAGDIIEIEFAKGRINTQI